jgi:hypothetical protein
MTDAELDRIADAVPIDTIGVHITTWHRRFARAVLAAQPLHEQLREMGEAYAAQPAPVPDENPKCPDCGHRALGVGCDMRVPHRAAQPAPAAKCDGGTCGAGGYCDNCPKQAAAPVPVPLTDEQIDTLIMQHTGGFIGGMHFVHLARAIERAHGIAASPEVPHG